MERFEVTILGCGSATPTLKRRTASQVVNINEQFFLIDCGECTQIELRKRKIKFQRINHICISHLHGDHYLGLFGLLSTMHLLGRTNELHLYAPAELKEIIDVQLKASDTRLRYDLHFHPLSGRPQTLVDGKHYRIRSFPLKHRLFCCGFVFEEKKKPYRINKTKAEELGVPVAAYKDLKNGIAYVDEAGEKIPLKKVTYPPKKARIYAYCSDTVFDPELPQHIQGVDLMYHESTFLEDKKERAKETFHSTAMQAAEIAKRAGAGRLILGHYSARYKDVGQFAKEARTVFPNTFLSEDGKVFSIEIGE